MQQGESRVTTSVELTVWHLLGVNRTSLASCVSTVLIGADCRCPYVLY